MARNPPTVRMRRLGASRYLLGDGSILLSYRLGHSCWLAEGDQISGPALPVFTFRDGWFRAVLGYETLTAHRVEHERQ
jgi:hypothetical protein